MPGHERSHHRRVVDEARRLLGRPARQESLVAAAVVGEFMRDRADERVAVSTGRVQRQEFRDLDARHVGANRTELPADFRRCIRLHVVGLVVRWSARQPDKEHARVRWDGDGSPGLAQPEEIGEAEAAEAERAGREHAASRYRPWAAARRIGYRTVGPRSVRSGIVSQHSPSPPGTWDWRREESPTARSCRIVPQGPLTSKIAGRGESLSSRTRIPRLLRHFRPESCPPPRPPRR